MAISCTYTTINGMLMHENRGGTETEYIPDPLGNLIQCRNSSGTKTYEATYWPYGEIRTETGTNPSPWSFVGLLGYLRDMANLLYVRARYYQPNFTRWMTVDPLWPMERPYNYAGSNPAQYSDPSGLVISIEGGLSDLDRRHIGGILNQLWRELDKVRKEMLDCLQTHFSRCPEWGGGVTYAEPDETIGRRFGDSTDPQVRITFGGSACDHKSKPCAYTKKEGNTFVIHLCIPRFLDPTKCGRRVCTLLHELIHATGHTHRGDNDELFLCVRLIPGCENFGARSVHPPKEAIK